MEDGEGVLAGLASRTPGRYCKNCSHRRRRQHHRPEREHRGRLTSIYLSSSIFFFPDQTLQSLERMALSLAKDKLSYNPAQLEDLSNRLRVGDLTPILQIYEEDIKSPVRSLVSGSLLRSAFIQIQKAKVRHFPVFANSYLQHIFSQVDVDQALAGIDKLLKSQELTFAFVGVAPALSLVYVVGGNMGKLFAPSHGHMGGKRRRTAAWLAMRRIERLLITQPGIHGHARHFTHTHAEHHDTKGVN